MNPLLNALLSETPGAKKGLRCRRLRPGRLMARPRGFFWWCVYGLATAGFFVPGGFARGAPPDELEFEADSANVTVEESPEPVEAQPLDVGAFDETETAALPPPSNDACLSCGTVTPNTPFSFWTTGATADGSSSCDGGPSPDVWYCFTPTCDGTASINTCGSQVIPGGILDTVISVHSGCPGTSAPVGNEIICNDDCSTVCSPSDSCLSFPVIGGNTYRIRIAGLHAGYVGNFNFDLTFVPPPVVAGSNACATATTIGPGKIQGSTIGATASADPLLIPAFFTGSPDVWYRFTPQCSGPVTIDTCGLPCNGSAFDTVLSVYTGSCLVASVVPGAFNDDAGCPNHPLGSRVNFNAVGGKTYGIRIAGYGGQVGNYVLNLVHNTTAPANNVCSASNPVHPGGTIGFSTGCGATTDGPASCPVTNDIWYRWQAPSQCSTPVTMHTCGSNFDTYLAVYTGSCPTLTQVTGACNDDTGTTGFTVPCPSTLSSKVQFTPTPNQWYYIRVGGYSGGVGVGKLTIDGPNSSPGTCHTTGTVAERLFNINGPANNTSWSWCIRSACCSNLQNLNVPGVPGIGSLCTQENNLAIAFANSINAAGCSGVSAAHMTPQASNNNTCGLLKVKRRCALNTPFNLSVGPAGTSCAGQCVVADVFGVDPTGPFGPCGFNPDMEEIPLSGMDCNANGTDDMIELLEGTSVDEDGDGLLDECIAVGCGSCRLYGDVSANYCVIDVDDIIRVLDGFVDSAAFPEADVAPCEPDGVVDVDDISAVLGAFVGFAECPDPCPPGACIVSEKECLDEYSSFGISESDCFISGGFYCGDYTHCGDPGCP